MAEDKVVHVGQLGKKLQDFYDGIAVEPLPPRFVELIAQLCERDRLEEAKPPPSVTPRR